MNRYTEKVDGIWSVSCKYEEPPYPVVTTVGHRPPRRHRGHPGRRVRPGSATRTGTGGSRETARGDTP